ncbi:F-box domain-containing protein [Favolaschia claudopus]|uniref:F-box domain-containing protein n=1 Tax=Favolaschia claudopus TaxID=2862362 RepID=A0AAW0CUS9_9AGAR
MSLPPAHLSILDLPFELISLVFILCLPIRRRVRPHPDHPPLSLAGVCSRWRAIALAIPELWTSMLIEFNELVLYEEISRLFDPSLATPPVHPTALLMNAWFARSAGYPLSVSLNCVENSFIPHGVLDTMALYQTQWGRIELNVPEADLSAFDRITVGPFPLLETLSTHITDTEELSYLIDLDSKFIRYSPRLKALDLSEYAFTLTSLRTLTWTPQNLTALQLRCDATRDPVPATEGPFSVVLEHFPGLLHLDIFVDYFSRELPVERLSTPFQTLMLNDDAMLDYLCAPTLQYLHVLAIMTTTPLLTFLAQSQCRLSTLSISVDFRISNDDWHAVLAALPDLRTLLLRLPQSSPVMQSCNTLLGGAASDQVPNLQTLVMSQDLTDSDPFPYTQWIELLRTRNDTILYADLFVRSWQPPLPEINTQLGAGLGAIKVRIFFETSPAHDYTQDVIGDLDFPFFSGPHFKDVEPGDIRPYYFSPFSNGAM